MISPRNEVLNLSEAVHGASDNAELAVRGIAAPAVLDFSANINPFGPSRNVVDALSKVPLHRYPDREATELRQVLAAQLDVPLESLLAGNGSSELLYLIALAYLRPNDVVAIVGPTYSEYARIATLMGARLVHWDATVESKFDVESSLLQRSLAAHETRAVFLCHPNNPTGQCLPTSLVRQWIVEFPKTLFVVDEAYLDFSVAAGSLVDVGRDNLVVLRSLTKAHGLAGLRLGYAVAHPELIRVLCRVRPPWSVNAFAQAAGVAALNDSTHLRKSVTLLLAEKESLVKSLEALRLAPFPSATHFFLVRVQNANELRERLLESQIILRDCTSFGLPQFLRISPRSSSENARLIDVLARLRFASSPVKQL